MLTSKSILMTAPVGFGKTIVSAYFAQKIIEKGKTMFFCVHTKDLMTQTIKAFSKFNIKFGIMASGYPEAKRMPIQLCSIPTLKNRIEKYYTPSMVVVDECHFCGAPGWAKIVKYYKEKGSYIVGLSASPWRLDGSGLGEQFDKIVSGVSVRWLIDNKYLSEYKLYAPSTIDTSKFHMKMGEYDQKETAFAMDKPSVIGSAIKSYKQFADGRNSIAFCVSVEHSKHTAAEFNANGIRAVHLDGECDIQYRKKVINDFASGDIKVITNCALFSAGFDLSLQANKDITVESVILLRPTASLSLYVQMTGRALRYKNYPAIILDHASCCLQHGLPDDDREWTLKGIDQNKKQSEKVSGIRICGGCFAACRPTERVCRFCGKEFEIKYRKVAEQDGELKEIDIVQARRVQKMEQGKATTLEQLTELGKRRGYKRAHLWAQWVLRARKQKAER